MPTNKFFSDDEGNRSSMRLMSFSALVIAALLALIPLFTKQEGDNLHVLYFLTAAFAPKTVQKFAEKKNQATSSGSS